MVQIYLNNIIFLKDTLFVELHFLLLAYFHVLKIAICFTRYINNTKAIAVLTSAIYSRLNFANSKITHKFSYTKNNSQFHTQSFNLSNFRNNSTMKTKKSGVGVVWWRTRATCHNRVLVTCERHLSNIPAFQDLNGMNFHL